MLEVCLLGTGGMMPLPYRHLTSLMTRLNGHSLLIDCGEATQIAIRKKGWSFKPIDVLCITHFHADHISGLPGLLLTMGNADRSEPLTVIGPKGIEKVVNSLRIIAPELPFNINFIEIKSDTQEFKLFDYRIKAFKVNHNVLCYGYTIELDRLPKFNPDAADRLGIPLRLRGILQKGDSVEHEGKVFTPDMVMGAARRGIKLTYTTDSRPAKSIYENAVNSDLFICEGMYGPNEEQDRAEAYKHMTIQEALNIALDSNVKELWLTHFSPAIAKPKVYSDYVKSVFENAYIGKDGMSKILNFDDKIME